MKKITLLFIAASLSLMSCSSNEKSSETLSNDVLVKSITYSNPTSSATLTTTFTYDGNKILSMVSDIYGGRKSIYSYTGDFITKIEVFDQNNVLKYTDIFDYKDGKLAMWTEQDADGPWVSKKIYTHNSDGTVEYVMTETNTDTNQTDEFSLGGKLIFSNGNMISFLHSSNGNIEETDTMEYDTKNNPFKNIIGYNLMLDYFNPISVNNITKKTNVGVNSSHISSMTYIYNNNNFPIEEKSYSDGNLDYTTKYTY